MGHAARVGNATGGSGAPNLIDATDVAYGLNTSGAGDANATALSAANTAAVAAGKKLWIPKGTYSTTAVTFTARIMMGTGSIFTCSAGVLAFNGGVEWDISPHLTLTGTATATFSKQKTYVGYAEWWGAVTNDASYAATTLAAINAAIIAVTKTQLLPATYYTSSVVNHLTNDHELCGASALMGWYLSGEIGSIISSTSASAGLLEVSSWGSKIKDILFTRSVAPSISSACVGIRISAMTWGVVFDGVISSESMIGWKFNKSQWAHLNRCRAHRFVAGTGGGTDTFKGFWIDGTPAAGTSGGNASFYMSEGFVQVGPPFTGTSIAYYSDKNFADTFLHTIESYNCTQGLVVVGNASVALGVANGDFIVTNAIFDSCAGTAIEISNTDEAGNLSITTGECSQQGSTASPMILVSSSLSSVSITGLHLLAINNATGNAIQITDSVNVTTNNYIIEARGKAVQLSSSNNCSINDRVMNNTYTGQGIQLTNSSRNKLNATMSGVTLGVGYKVTDATSGYNEFNCTGLDPAGITGGAANKLVINGAQVVAVGIAAAGHGTNVASGVMA